MPIPILPMSMPSDDKNANRLPETSVNYQALDISNLQSIIHQTNSKSNIKVSNSDASLLFKFWQSNEIVKENDIEYVRVGEQFSNNDVLRLKALGFVVGSETNIVKFTERAREVIKTIVLSEDNNFLSNRVNKPYNEILAEQNRPAGIRLALDKKK